MPVIIEPIEVAMQYVRLAGKWFFPTILVITSLCVFVPFSPSMPGEGLDSSWFFGMNQAVAQGLVFGRDIIFTFGPYASIYTKTYHPATDGLMVWGSLYLGLSFSFAAFLNFKESKWYFQTILLVVLAGLMYGRDSLLFFYPLLVGVYIFKTTAINSEAPEFPVRSRLVLGFLIAPFGLLPLIKGSALIICTAIAVLAFAHFLIKRNWKSAAIVGIVPTISLVVFSILSGQPTSGLPLYITSLLPIIAGYTEAMATNGEEKEITYYIAAAVLLLWIFFNEKKSEFKQKIIIALALSIALFLAFKGGFVRHDGHAITSGTMLLLTGVVASSFYGSNRSLLGLIGVFFVWAYIDSHYIKTSTYSFLQNISNTYNHSLDGLIMRIGDTNKLKKNYEETVERLRIKSEFPKLQGTTDIYSCDQSYLIASGNVWHPRPIFQSYSVYTPVLVAKNRDHLISDRSPDNLIFKVQPIDGRIPAIEDGASWPVIFSKYSPTAMLGDFLLLKKRKTGVDIPETIIFKEKVVLGQKVSIPEGAAPVFAKIHINQSISGKLANTFFKPSQLQITLDLDVGSTRKYRIVSGMAKSGLLISPLIEDTKEFGLLYAGGGYLYDKRVKSFTIEAVSGKSLWVSEYEIEFVALNLPVHQEALGLYAFENPKLLAPSDKVALTEVCDGSIDYVNGTSPAPPDFSVRSLLNVHGWLAKSAQTAVLPQSAKLLLSTEDGQRYLIETKRTSRPDVGAYFKKSELDASGYSVAADVSQLRGRYSLRLGYQEMGAIKLCPQFNIKANFTGN